MARLLVHAKASSHIVKILQAFGLKSFAQDEGYGHCDVTITRNEDGVTKALGKSKFPPRW